MPDYVSLDPIVWFLYWSYLAGVEDLASESRIRDHRFWALGSM